MKFHTVSTLCLLVALAALGGLSSSRGEPPSGLAAPESSSTKTSDEATPAIPIKDVRKGQRVSLEGEVVRLRDTDEFVLRDPTGEIGVYIGWRNEMPVDVGDRIRVIGMADDDALPGTRPEVYARMLVLENGHRVNLRTGETLKPDEVSKVELEYQKRTAAGPISEADAGRPVSLIKDIKPGQPVKLHGTVTRIPDEDEFILRDETGRILVYIGWRNDLPVEVGDEVTVLGRADDDALPLLRPEIYAQTLILSGGEQVNLYTNRSSRGE